MKLFPVLLTVIFVNIQTAIGQNIQVLRPADKNFTEYSLKEQQYWEKAVTLNNKINEFQLKYDNLPAAEKIMIDSLEMGFGPMTQGPECSWYCGGGPYKLTASDNLAANNGITYIADNAHDFNLFTPWIPDTQTGAIGKKLNFYFEPRGPRITTIIIWNGYIKNKVLWKQNARVKKLKFYINDKPYAILELDDESSAQYFKIPAVNSPVEKVDLVFTFEILEIYKGSKWQDVAISEINFDGIDVH